MEPSIVRGRTFANSWTLSPLSANFSGKILRSTSVNSKRFREAEEKRRANLVSIDHRGRVIENGAAKPYLPTNPDGSYIRSPLQEKVWSEQSREFARLRGEIVDLPTTPVVETPDRSTAYRLTLDGFLFWGDNTPCESPLPAGTKVINAPTPQRYHQNENQIPAGMKFDPISFFGCKSNEPRDGGKDTRHGQRREKGKGTAYAHRRKREPSQCSLQSAIA